ncbi:MAG: FAD-binding oxidoreductase, partial [Rhodospirillaceae bacterium]|nr:FAD-binding oxidoreductase [Rhodospirillaceae bacterium]
AVVEAGVVLSALQEEAAEHGLSTAIDLGARDSATIGGLISTNAGGIEAFRFGTMRHRILGIEAVLPSGEIVSDLKRVVKANEGYDIKQLLIGAEGTLGIVTRAVVNLVPLDGETATGLVSCPTSGDALALFKRLRASQKATLVASEIMWPGFARATSAALGLDALTAFAPDDHVYLLVEMAGETSDGTQMIVEELLGDALEAQEASDAVLAKSAEERRRMWLIREESFEADKAMPHGFWYDISVPHACLERYTDDLFPRMAAIDPALVVFMFGHLGDGNLHLTITRGTPMEELHDRVNTVLFEGLMEAGGSFSAEHGIGLEKRQLLRERGSAEKNDAMHAIKAALDSAGIMNPGKVI